jgi:hypothetical protein
MIVENVSRPNTLAEASASASFGVSVSWNRGTSVSGTVYCPDNVICGLTAAAKYIHVEGIATMHYCGWIGGIDPNAYPCVLPPSSICSNEVPAEVPYPFTSVCSLPSELFKKFVLTCS